jgi:hypothetical protein
MLKLLLELLLLLLGVLSMGAREEWTRPLAVLQMPVIATHSAEGATPRWNCVMASAAARPTRLKVPVKQQAVQ